MENPKKLKAKELRQKMEDTASYIDELENEFEEYERELILRGLKVEK